MITFNCNKASLIRLILRLGVCLIIPDRARPGYFELRRNGGLIGYWNSISGDGELHAEGLSAPLEKLIAINK